MGLIAMPAGRNYKIELPRTHASLSSGVCASVANCLSRRIVSLKGQIEGEQCDGPQNDPPNATKTHFDRRSNCIK